MGDFISQHTLWGCADTNDKGRTIEDFITKDDLVLLNDKSSTYLHPATGSYSSLDLTICSPGIFPDFTKKVVDDLHGSEHFPIQVSEVGPSVQQRPQRWKLHKAIANSQFIPTLLKILKILQSFSPPYFIPLLKSPFLELRQIQSTKTSHGLMMIARRL